MMIYNKKAATGEGIKSLREIDKLRFTLNKKAATGEGIFTIYRILIVTIVAFAIFGISSIFYSYSIDVRDAEAAIMARNVLNCLSKDNVLDIDLVSEENKNKILDYCGFDEEEVGRFFVRVNITDLNDELISTFSQGDSGKLWVKRLYENSNLRGNSLKYEPGYFPYKNEEVDYFIYVIKDGEKIKSKVNVEVLVSDE